MIAVALAAAAVLFTPGDMLFLHMMTMHHGQALEMESLIAGRTERADFIRFARLIAEGQRAEIAAMEELSALGVARGAVMPYHDMAGDPPMAGMLSKAEMAALAASTGAEFERRWLEGMIFHHEGGLAMTRVQELQQAAVGRQPYGLAVMIDDILVEQRAEIAKMRDWLVEWKLDRGDTRAPVAEVIAPAEGEAVAVGVPVTLYGTAVDDRGIGSATVTIGRKPVRATLIGSGPASAAWTASFTLPVKGHASVGLEVIDASGKKSDRGEARTIVVK